MIGAATALRTGLVALLGLYASFCSAEYVTDKLVAGLYETAATDGTLVRALPSGTPLEVIERRGTIVRVRTGDGLEGWIGREYVTGEKPAQVMLLQLQAEMGDLKQRLRQAETDLDAAREVHAEAAPEAAPMAPVDGISDGSHVETSHVSMYLLTGLIFLCIGFFGGRLLAMPDLPKAMRRRPKERPAP